MEPKSSSKTNRNPVSAKVSDEVLAAVLECAKLARVPQGVWFRRVIEQAVKGELEHRILLAEFMSLRTSLLKGMRELVSGSRLTVQEFEAIVLDAEARKFDQAEGRILEGRQR